jgi:hypothetical protein
MQWVAGREGKQLDLRLYLLAPKRQGGSEQTAMETGGEEAGLQESDEVETLKPFQQADDRARDPLS